MPAPLAPRSRDTRGRTPTKLTAAITGAVACVLLTGGCTGDSPGESDGPADPGPLTTSLDGGGNSIYPPRDAGERWPATFGGLLICSPEPVTLTDVVPHYRAGKPASVDFLVRTVPGSDDRGGSAIAWAPAGTATEAPEQLAENGDLRYATLTKAAGAEVNQACDDDPSGPFTEILTAVTADAGGVWIDRLDVKYVMDGKAYSLPVNWSYVACGDLIGDAEVC